MRPTTPGSACSWSVTNPGMEQLALVLSQRNALRDRLAAKYPTGALAEIALPGGRIGATWRKARAR